MDQIFALQQVFEKLWEYAKEMHTCFVDLEKAYDCVSRDKLWAVLLDYDVSGQLLAAIKSLYCTNSQKSVFVSMALKQNLLMLVLDYNRAVFFLLFCLLCTWTE